MIAHAEEEFFRFEEDAARRIAEIIGPASAAALAIANLEQRRTAGEDAVIWRDGKRWIVGPRPSDED